MGAAPLLPEHLRIGCAGWMIPKQHAALFPASGSHLDRYARCFAAVEINSSFYKPHRRATYERWSVTVPGGFAFSIKAPRLITHTLRLAGVEAALDVFLEQARGCGGKLGPLLFQFPPSLAFDALLAGSFFAALRARFDGCVVCEPRHPSWFAARSEELMTAFRISRVATDPPVVGAASEPGGWSGLAYFRLHGSPRIYYSEYSADQIERLAQQLVTLCSDRPVWCIFDNTAAGAATANALALSAACRRSWAFSTGRRGPLARGAHS